MTTDAILFVYHVRRGEELRIYPVIISSERDSVENPKEVPAGRWAGLKEYISIGINRVFKRSKPILYLRNIFL